jgi:Family of unknown function (DUF6176)
MYMAVFLGAFPVLPGKEDATRKFAQELAGRREEYAASQKKSGITKEEWSLQETPMGALVVVRFECPDVEESFSGFAASTDPFDMWFKERVMEVSGVDLGAPPEGPPPEIIHDWRA